MGFLDTQGQSEISFSSRAESSFISSSMGKNFGIFGRLDFDLAVFFLGFMWNAFTHNIGTLHGHGFRAAGRNKEFGLGEGLDLFEAGVGSEFAEEESCGRDVDEGEFGDDVIYDFDARER